MVEAVRNAMLRGGADDQMQRALNHNVDNWIKIFMSSTDSGLQRIKQAANTGAQNKAAEFLLREVESREFLGSWLHSSAVHEAKKRRTKQVISCLFPCGKWLHMIGARTSPGCELCKRERKTDSGATKFQWRQWLAFKVLAVKHRRRA